MTGDPTAIGPMQPAFMATPSLLVIVAALAAAVVLGILWMAGFLAARRYSDPAGPSRSKRACIIHLGAVRAPTHRWRSADDPRIV